MSKIIYNKLVRDKIPEIIEASGKTCETEILSDEEYLQMIDKKLGNTITYAIIIIMCLIWVTPFVCILLESFRMETTMQVGYVIPKQWGIGNYVSLIKNTNFVKWYANTLIIAIAVSAILTFDFVRPWRLSCLGIR